ncbi:acetyl-coenzyme A synthetase [Salpingoeca rosetta]|uniref:acetate--CoA ligase n=1 Tax=Salpingoeca rosetta (strain ATCC 50818 / BSB-021) TaxID=946362 RepID=F2UQ76_SALR5|nr:acetyl-coenzyme A synthetase [Salpingoeca rosetta]EGD79744.1 acetyl-coenzyme A synthetase [Salpingoeca rosetta]|eukprot:XP_004988693.1 acetyl-coenzyme A synthetase [Salpingoeca rosetta]
MSKFMELADAPTKEKELYQPSNHARKGAHVASLAEYEKMYRESIENPEAFWTRIAEQFHWEKKWDEFHSWNYDREQGPVKISWFKGGLTNICYNVLDRHVEAGRGDRVAFFWEGNEVADQATVTYAQLLDRVKRTANVLKSLGVKKSDTVAIYQPMIVDLVVAMLACARIGAVHSIVFGGFSAEALADRIIDAKSNVVFTADGSFRGSKFVDLKSLTDEALAICSKRGFSVEHCIVSRNVREKRPTEMQWHNGRDKWFDELEAQASADCAPEWVDAEHELFLLYTSGSTGRPKGVVHTHGGYMVWTATTHKYTFDYHDDDVSGVQLRSVMLCGCLCARRDADGYYWITGRIDDVINVSGHRLGTAELESALAQHEAVVEAAVVGYPHEIKGEGIYCYVVLNPGFEFGPQLVKELKQHVRQHIGPFAQPDLIQYAPGLPKTRSGKVMRRILRKIASKEESSLGDTSTLADPSVVDAIIENRVH